MFGLGPAELCIIGLIMLLLFGSRLPTVMRGMGQGITEFKRGLSGVTEEVRTVEHEIRKN